MTHPENLTVGTWYELRIVQHYGDGFRCVTTFCLPMLLEFITWDRPHIELRFWSVEMGRVDVTWRDVLRCVPEVKGARSK